MKKILSIALALCMVCALSATAFASSGSDTWATGATGTDITPVTGEDFNQNETIDVPGQLSDAFSGLTGDEAAANYVVVLTWDVTSDLTYHIDAEDYAWTVYDGDNRASTSADFTAPAAAGYVGDGYWTGSAAVKMTVTNWSNRALNAAFTYADKTTEADGIEGSINTANNDCRTWTSSDLVNNANNKGETTWTADAANAYEGGTLALANPAAGVAIRAGESANNHTAGTVTVNIKACSDANAPKTTQLMNGDISAAGVTIGTVTVTITKA